MSVQKTYTIDLNKLDWDPTWPTQHADLAAALEIVTRHQAETGKLRLLDDWGENEKGELWVKMPAWVIELGEHYDTIYGSGAEAIMQRVMRILVPFEQVH